MDLASGQAALEIPADSHQEGNKHSIWVTCSANWFIATN